jgi:hypothetical protein
MPDGNGHELMRWIALNLPATRTVLMSGFDVGCEKCSFSPRCKLLAKPFKPEEAVALLTTVGRRKRKAGPFGAFWGLQK